MRGIHRYNEALLDPSLPTPCFDIAQVRVLALDMIAAQTSGKVFWGDIAADAIAEMCPAMEKSQYESKVLLTVPGLVFPDKLFSIKVVSFEIDRTHRSVPGNGGPNLPGC